MRNAPLNKQNTKQNVLIRRHDEGIQVSLFEEFEIRFGQGTYLGLVLLPGQDELNLGLGPVGKHRTGLDEDLVDVVVLGQVVGHEVRLLLKTEGVRQNRQEFILRV